MSTDVQVLEQPAPAETSLTSPKADSVTLLGHEATVALNRVRAQRAARPVSDEEISARLKREEVRKQVEKIELSMRLWESSGVDARYIGVDLDKLPGGLPEGYHQAVAVVRSLLEKTGLLIMLGGNGTGKTAISCGLVKDFCRKGQRAIYTTAFHMLLDVTSTNCPAAKETTKQVFNLFVEPSLLVIDEIDKRKITEYSVSILTNLIDDRYRKLKSTVLITNQDEAEFESTIGSSAVSRSKDDGGFFPCNWGDLRGLNLKTI